LGRVLVGMEDEFSACRDALCAMAMPVRADDCEDVPRSGWIGPPEGGAAKGGAAEGMIRARCAAAKHGATALGLVFRGGEEPSVDEARGVLGRFREGVQGLLEVLEMEGQGCGRTRHAALQKASASVVSSSVQLVDDLKRGERSEEGVGRGVGKVWAAVDGAERVPMSDLQACGRALVNDLVLVNDVLREMREEMVPSSAGEGDGGSDESPASVLSETEAEDEAWEEEEGLRVPLGLAVVNGYVAVVKAFLRGTASKGGRAGVGVSAEVVSAVEEMVRCGKLGGVACETVGAGLWPPQDCDALALALAEVDGATKDLVRAAEKVLDGLLWASEDEAASREEGKEAVRVAHSALTDAVAAMAASLR